MARPWGLRQWLASWPWRRGWGSLPVLPRRPQNWAKRQGVRRRQLRMPRRSTEDTSAPAHVSARPRTLGPKMSTPTHAGRISPHRSMTPTSRTKRMMTQAGRTITPRNCRTKLTEQAAMRASSRLSASASTEAPRSGLGYRPSPRRGADRPRAELAGQRAPLAENTAKRARNPA